MEIKDFSLDLRNDIEMACNEGGGVYMGSKFVPFSTKYPDLDITDFDQDGIFHDGGGLQLIFRFNGTLMAVDGHYSSWSSNYYDWHKPYPVKLVQKTIEVYERAD